MVRAVAGISLGLMAGTAHASMVRADDPSTLVREMQAMGYRAELTKDDSGDPMIKSSSSGTDFAIFFYGCEKNRNCRTIQFFAGFADPKKSSLSAMNEWNKLNRFSRVYVTDTGAARIELDLDLDDGGMSSALFQDNVEFWTIMMAKFEGYVMKD